MATAGNRPGRSKRIDPVIVDSMSANGIDPFDAALIGNCNPFDPSDPGSISRSKRYILVKGYARHEHEYDSFASCSRWWSSANSWCVIDLKKQRIIHSYGQNCRRCDGKSTPFFEDEAKVRMTEYACKTHLYRTGKLKRARNIHRFPDMKDISGEREGHHDMTRCDMCQLLGHCCQKNDFQRIVEASSSSSSSFEDDELLESPQLILGCSFCGKTGHSYITCTLRREQQQIQADMQLSAEQPSTDIPYRNPYRLDQMQHALHDSIYLPPVTTASLVQSTHPYVEVQQGRSTVSATNLPPSASNQHVHTNLATPVSVEFDLGNAATRGLAVVRGAVTKVGRFLFRRK